MRALSYALVLFVSVAAGLSTAQVPMPPRPQFSKEQLEQIKKKIDELGDSIKKAEDEREALTPPEPMPRTEVDIAGIVFGEMFRACGSPTYTYYLLETYGENDETEPVVDAAQGRYDLASKKVEQLEAERTALREMYFYGGGPSDLSASYLPMTPSDEQKRLEEEYRERERQRLADEEKRKKEASKPSSPPPPPPPPPISSVTDTPCMDFAFNANVADTGTPMSAGYYMGYVGNTSTTTPLMLSSGWDPTTQGKDAFLEESGGFPLVVEPARYWAVPQRDSRVNWPQQPSVIFAALRPPPAALRTSLDQGSSAIGKPQPSAKVFFTDLGGSTGETIQMTVVNDGNVPVRIASDGFALVPLANMTAADVERELQRLADKPRTTVNIRAYCRDLRKPPPVAGRVMRLADAATQAQMAPFQRVLAASRRLLDSGALRPDVDDRELYLDSVRQWARWTMAEKFNARTFITAFIEHTKKNTIAAGQKWEKAFDTEARQIAGERWRDVQRVLSEALR